MSLISAILRCPRCAKELPSAVRFCRRCGLALEARAISAPLAVRADGWAKVASFGTASAWHVAKTLLAKHQILSRMDADASSTEQRMDLLVLAAEWARARKILSLPIVPQQQD